MDYTNMTYNQLSAAFIRGKLDAYEALDAYSKARAAAMRQIARIQKSSIPFLDAPPTFITPSSISSTSDLLHALADVNRFRSSSDYSLKSRAAKQEKAIATLRENGLDFINKENYASYVDFMRWFYNNSLNKIYGSQEDVVEDFFREKWERVSGYKTTAAKKGALTKFVNEMMG